MIRKKGLIFLVTVVVLFLIGWWLFSDSWIEAKLEGAISSVTGAVVEIDDLDTEWFPFGLEFKRLQIADPENTMTNMFESGHGKISLNVLSLIHKQIIINDITVENIATDTPREKDGALPKNDKNEEKGSFGKKWGDKLGKIISAEKPESNFKNLNTEDLLKKAAINSPQKIDSMRKEVERKLVYWEDKLGKVKPEDDLNELRRELKDINVKKIKKLSELKKALKKVKKIKKRADSLKKVYGPLNKELAGDLREMKRANEFIGSWIEDDFTLIKELLPVGDIDKMKPVELLLGEKLSVKYAKFRYYYDKYKHFLVDHKGKKNKKEKPKRLKGQTIALVAETELPSLWIKNIHISGEAAKRFSIDGKITDFSSNQSLSGQPMTVSIDGKENSGAALTVKGFSDHVKEEFQDKLSFTIKDLRVNDYPLFPGGAFPRSMQKGNVYAEVELNLTDTLENVRLYFKVTDCQFAFSDEQEGRLAQAVKEGFTGVREVDVEGNIAFKGGKEKIELHSNIDKIFGDALEKAVGKEIAGIKKKLRKKLEERIAPQREQLEREINKVTAMLEEKLNLHEDTLNSSEKEAKKKKKELEKALKKKGVKSGKDLLKKIL